LGAAVPGDGILVASFFTALALPAVLIVWLYQRRVIDKPDADPRNNESKSSGQLRDQRALPASIVARRQEPSSMKSDAGAIRNVLRRSAPARVLHNAPSSEPPQQAASGSTNATDEANSAEAASACMPVSSSASCDISHETKGKGPGALKSKLHDISKARAATVMAEVRARAARTVAQSVEQRPLTMQQEWLMTAMHAAAMTEEAPLRVQNSWLDLAMLDLEIDSSP